MKYAKLLALTAIALGFTACSGDEGIPAPKGESTVTLTLNASLPRNIQSRAFSDGTIAIHLSYAVYEHGQTTPVINSLELPDEKQSKFTDLVSSPRIQLVTGKSYDLVFWADAHGKAGAATSPYIFNPATQTVTVNYEGAVASDETRDAFFGQIIGLKATEDMSQDVVLKRPFAQINVGTDDKAVAPTLAAGDIHAAMTLSKAYKTLNLLDGSVADEVLGVKFQAAPIPSGETFPHEGFDYLEMNYVLMERDVTRDVTLSFTGKEFSHTIEVPAVPLKRNYRTNIYGSLLTSNVDFTIKIIPNFDDPDWNVAAENSANP